MNNQLLAYHLLSEKDTRPHWETDRRGMFMPIMRNGYNNALSLAMPEALGGHGASVMSDIVQGKPLTQDEVSHGAQGAANFMFTGGLAGNIGKRPQAGVASMFGGTSSKTADMGMHNRANLMESAGAPREQIWKDTGWFKGVDGKWRNEIDDGTSGITAQFRNEPSGSGQWAPNALVHDDLYKAYPDTKSLFMQKQGFPGGAFDEMTGTIHAGGSNGGQLRSTALHEMQHAVQGKEGFASGGAGAETNYNALAGEVEARAVQARMDLTPAQRRARPPWLDYDVPEAQQIVRFGSDGPQMSSSGAQPPKVPTAPARDLDGLGYYSAALEAAKAWPQSKGTPEQAMAWLTKNGTKQAEIDATGVGNAFSGPVTRDDLVKYLGENRVGVRETEYKKKGNIPNLDQLAVQEFGVSYANLDPGSQRSVRMLADGQTDGTKWSRHSLDPSNPTYRETVLSLPGADDQIAAFRARTGAPEDSFAAQRFFDANPNLKAEQDKLIAARSSEFRSGHFPEPNIVGHMMSSLNKHEGKPVYTLDQIQSDWGQKIRNTLDANGVAELRAKIDALNLPVELRNADARNPTVDIVRSLNRFKQQLAAGFVRDPDGSQLRAKEAAVQYAKDHPEKVVDFHRMSAELRTNQNKVAGHPLVNTTDQWTNTTLRRGLQQAIDAEAEYMAIPHGDTVLSYNPGDDAGMRGFYGTREAEGIVPKNLRKILEKLDKGAPRPFRTETLETPTGPMGYSTRSGDPFDPAQTGYSMFQITPAMREQARKGLPLFMNPQTAAIAPLAGNAGQDRRNHLMGY